MPSVIPIRCSGDTLLGYSPSSTPSSWRCLRRSTIGGCHLATPPVARPSSRSIGFRLTCERGVDWRVGYSPCYMFPPVNLVDLCPLHSWFDVAGNINCAVNCGCPLFNPMHAVVKDRTDQFYCTLFVEKTHFTGLRQESTYNSKTLMSLIYRN